MTSGVVKVVAIAGALYIGWWFYQNNWGDDTGGS